MKKIRFVLAVLLAFIGMGMAYSNAKVYNKTARYTHTGTTYILIPAYHFLKCTGIPATHCSYILVIPDGVLPPASFVVPPPYTISFSPDEASPKRRYVRL